ncbi:hypothetical protein BU15DRAFT_63743 [Melanogaster broomeanus]|nr:hypothetical protein BU15DRAFT_63743 [Melanogaster broomeanus]
MSNYSDSLSSSPLFPIIAELIAREFTIEEIVCHLEALTVNAYQQEPFSSTSTPSQHIPSAVEAAIYETFPNQELGGNPSAVEAAFHGTYPGQNGNTSMSLGSSSASPGLATQYSIGGSEPRRCWSLGRQTAHSAATAVPNPNTVPLAVQTTACEHVCRLIPRHLRMHGHSTKRVRWSSALGQDAPTH